ncbi:hypothetical protein [Pseudomonas monsensis]
MTTWQMIRAWGSSAVLAGILLVMVVGASYAQKRYRKLQVAEMT